MILNKFLERNVNGRENKNINRLSGTIPGNRAIEDVDLHITKDGMINCRGGDINIRKRTPIMPIITIVNSMIANPTMRDNNVTGTENHVLIAD